MANQVEAILQIYDAAIDEGRWSSALDESIKVIGADSVSIHMVDLSGKSPYVVDYTGGLLSKMTPSDFDYYMENLAGLEKDAWELLQASPAQKIIEDNEIWPDIDAIRNRADYRYLEEHVGFFRRMIARLNDNKSWFDAIAIQFNPTVIEIPSASKEAAVRLLPHIAKSFELSRTYQLLKKQYQAVLGALNHVHIGICISLADGTVIATNDEANRIFDLTDGIVIGRKGNIVCRDAELQAKLGLAIATTSLTARGESGATEQLMAISRPSGQHPILLEVAPLRDSLHELDHRVAGSLIALIDPSSPRRFDISRLTTAYGLTVAESSVCRFLVDGWTNQVIAEERRVSLETIKSQASSISRKTGARSRADLIRLAVKISPPIGS